VADDEKTERNFSLVQFLKRSHKGDARLLDFCERERDGTMIYCNLVCQVDTTDNVSQNYLPSSFLHLPAMCDEFSFVVFGNHPRSKRAFYNADE
jgi:hypothetical protein